MATYKVGDHVSERLVLDTDIKKPKYWVISKIEATKNTFYLNPSGHGAPKRIESQQTLDAFYTKKSS